MIYKLSCQVLLPDYVAYCKDCKVNCNFLTRDGNREATFTDATYFYTINFQIVQIEKMIK